MQARDAGFRPRNAWLVDRALVDATKEAVLSLRQKTEYGPRSRFRIVFRASELGNVAAFRDTKGEPGGCARKVFFSFHADTYKPRSLTAEQVMNFAKGESEEEVMAGYLAEAGLLVERQVRLGAWAPCRSPESCPWGARIVDGTSPTCGVSDYIHGDARFPDRSRGNARGKCDFFIRHPKNPEWGTIPLELKTSSSYSFGLLPKEGPKGDNGIQAQFYGHEAQTPYVALGYVDKESGEVVIFYDRTDYDGIEAVLNRCEWLRDFIQRGEVPPMPEGARPPQEDPTRYRLPADAYYDRAWPCYVYSSKKDRVTACEWFESCHGQDLPKEPPPQQKRRAAPRRGKAAKKGAPVSFDFESKENPT